VPTVGANRLPASLPPNSADNCLACHQKNNDEIIGLFQNSTHSRRHLSCKECHGGDAIATEKQAAHGQNFIGKPTPAQLLEMCSVCHQSVVGVFKKSLHFPEKIQQARLDCVQCHGAHTIGKIVRRSEFAVNCTNCHGLEYLPALPEPLQKILQIDDDVRDALGNLEKENRKASEEILRQRRDLRRQIAEIVHATNTQRAMEQAPTLLTSGEILKKQIAQTHSNR